MSDRFQELTIFVRAAETGSFSQTARELRLSQPSISRIVGELEARLGVRLLLRTTRRVTVTDTGAHFLERARDILATVEEAEDAARGRNSVSGLLRLALPIIYGTQQIVPLLPKFLAENPLLRVELSVSDVRQDLVAEGADVAFRLGRLADSSFGARKLPSLERVVVATPAYLAARGTPKAPADLAKHDCIAGPGEFGRTSWTFRKGEATITVDVSGRVTTNSGPGTLTSAINGLGIAMMTSTACQKELKSGELVRLLRGYSLEPIEVHAVFPAGPRPSPKVRAFLAFLESELERSPDH
ncbi:LysR family transcriptional regulator [Bradyrhizobium sp. USDA 4454]